MHGVAAALVAGGAAGPRWAGRGSPFSRPAARHAQEKRSIYDQISAADELKKQQQDLTQRLKNELQFYSVNDIDRRIKVRARGRGTAGRIAAGQRAASELAVAHRRPSRRVRRCA